MDWIKDRHYLGKKNLLKCGQNLVKLFFGLAENVCSHTHLRK